jgi:spermidine/putrescine transport system permease protein
MRRRVAPYLLLGPGAAWLLLFFVVPLYYLAELSLNSGVFGSYEFSWHWENYSDALQLYDSQFVRSFVYAGLATLFALLLATPSPTRLPSRRAAGATCSSSPWSPRSSPPT